MTDDVEIGLMFIIYILILYILLSLKFGFVPISSMIIIFFVIDCYVSTIYTNRCFSNCNECSFQNI
jgi:hypothetical protein